jgi:NAD(P)-dependent dehydrogenase (short-subunit alcohol dehydrogenase family)
MRSLAGKVAVVTGAANGIGRAVALELARAGMHVVVADIDEAKAEAVADAVRAVGVTSLAVATDVRSRQSVDDLARRANDEVGPVRVLHNNAGVGLIETIASTTDEDWRWVMDVNYFGVVNGLQAFLPRMLATEGDKHIVNTGSMSGLHPAPQLAGYNASKYAVVGLTEAMREELAEFDIGVSLVCPGLVGTGIQGRSRKYRSTQSRPAAPMPTTHQGGVWNASRIVSPESVARAVLRGIHDNELYVMTDPEDRQLVAGRFERLLAAFDRAIFE